MPLPHTAPSAASLIAAAQRVAIAQREAQQRRERFNAYASLRGQFHYA